jgi:hypothetical protein
MRLLVTLLAVLSLPLAARAADPVAEAGLSQDQLEDPFFGFLRAGHLPAHLVTPAMKALPPARRVALVKALGSAAREVFRSAAFRARWDEEVKANRPTPPAPARKPAELVAAQAAEFAATVAEMEKAMAQLPAEHQPEMRKAIDAMRSQRASAPAVPAELLAAAEQERVASETAEYQAALKRFPADPAVALRAQLERWLATTADVDFKAKTTAREGQRVFVEPRYEAKPSEWKLAYRAGREVTEAARAFAKGWLAELK